QDCSEEPVARERGGLSWFGARFLVIVRKLAMMAPQIRERPGTRCAQRQALLSQRPALLLNASLIDKSESPARASVRGFVMQASECLARRAPLPAIGVVPRHELALERLLIAGQRHAQILTMQIFELLAAIVSHRRCRCE